MYGYSKNPNNPRKHNRFRTRGRGRWGMYNSRTGNIVKGRYTPRMTKNSQSPFGFITTAMKDNTQLLPSGYTVGQTWEGLDKAWLAYVISKDESNEKRMVYYAGVIQKLQKELVDVGILDRGGLANFPNLKMYALGEIKDNARYLYDERVDMEQPDDQDDDDRKRQKKWLEEVYNSDGLQRVRY